jgi:hypothetical protein
MSRKTQDAALGAESTNTTQPPMTWRVTADGSARSRGGTRITANGEGEWTSTMASEDSDERVEARTEDAQMMSKSERHAMAAYIDMLARCYVPAHPEYINEGARGIRVCDRWLVGFHNFLEDVGPPPEVAGDNGNQNGVVGGVE